MVLIECVNQNDRLWRTELAPTALTNHKRPPPYWRLRHAAGYALAQRLWRLPGLQDQGPAPPHAAALHCIFIDVTVLYTLVYIYTDVYTQAATAAVTRRGAAYTLCIRILCI
jgi:hypothetical protein